MRIRCAHGYFMITESRAGEASGFVSRFGLPLVSKDDYFTFEELGDAPDFSIAGLAYLGAPATVTFAGRPWDVMRENGLVYNFQTGLLVQIETITQADQITQAGKYYVSNGLILPGSLTDEGQRVTDYAAWFSFDTLKFKYSEVALA